MIEFLSHLLSHFMPALFLLSSPFFFCLQRKKKKDKKKGKKKKKIESKNAFRSFLPECLLYSPVSLSVLLPQQPRLSSHFPISFWGNKGLKSGKQNEYERKKKKEGRRDETEKEVKGKVTLSGSLFLSVLYANILFFLCWYNTGKGEKKSIKRITDLRTRQNTLNESQRQDKRRLNLWTRWSIQGLFQRLLFLRQRYFRYILPQSLFLFLSLANIPRVRRRRSGNKREKTIQHRRKYSTQVIQRQFLSRDWEGPERLGLLYCRNWSGVEGKAYSWEKDKTQEEWVREEKGNSRKEQKSIDRLCLSLLMIIRVRDTHTSFSLSYQGKNYFSNNKPSCQSSTVLWTDTERLENICSFCPSFSLQVLYLLSVLKLVLIKKKIRRHITCLVLKKRSNFYHRILKSWSQDILKFGSSSPDISLVFLVSSLIILSYHTLSRSSLFCLVFCSSLGAFDSSFLLSAEQISCHLETELKWDQRRQTHDVSEWTSEGGWERISRASLLVSSCVSSCISFSDSHVYFLVSSSCLQSLSTILVYLSDSHVSSSCLGLLLFLWWRYFSFPSIRAMKSKRQANKQL